MLTELFSHQEWADALIWKTMRASDSSDQVLLGKVRHLMTVQWAFLTVWENGRLEPKEIDTAKPAVLLAMSRQYHERARACVASATGDALQRALRVPWQDAVERHFGRTAQTPTLAETMVQVVMHSTYHRGQISARLREIGQDPPLTDLIVWIWQGKPTAEWPVEA